MDHENHDHPESGDPIDQLKMVIASLESKIDLLEAELAYINQLLLQFGFPEGIVSLKLAIEELLRDDIDPPEDLDEK